MGNRLKEAKEYYQQSIELAKNDHNEISVIICLSGFALVEVMQENSDAKSYLRESILYKNLNNNPEQKMNIDGIAFIIAACISAVSEGIDCILFIINDLRQ